MLRELLVLACLAPAVLAVDLSAAASVNLRSKIVANLGMQARGVQNCDPKCSAAFDSTQYVINAQGNDTNEYLACTVGCTVANAQIAKFGQSAAHAKDCYTTCKNTDWLNIPGANGAMLQIVKGVVEPDKACMFGCVIGMAQGICTGGTTDIDVTPANKNFWWGAGGCSIKTGTTPTGGWYGQNSKYNFFNFPGGAGGQAQCCSNAHLLCPAKKTKSNAAWYNNLVVVTKRQCANVPGIAGNPKSHTVPQICAWFNTPGTCGTTL